MNTSLIDDDHIIALLRKDAQSNRSGSFRTERRDRNAPKPNTRFLRNLVRDTDSHNAALLAKEKAETRARLKELERGVERGRGTEGGSSRGEQGRKSEARGGEREGRWKGVMAGLGQPNFRERDGERREERHHRNRRDHRTGPSAKEAHDCSTRDDNRAQKQGRTQSFDSHPRSRSRSRSPTRHKRRSDRERRDHRRHRSRSRDKRPWPSHSPHDQLRNTKSTKSARQQESPPLSSDSDDPLAAFLGPAPPSNIRPRGRGAANSSTIDLRFNDPSYNPRADVAHPESEEDRERDREGDDWVLSLEAQRDRAAWRAKGAARLREAGFGDLEIGKWETGTGVRREKDERDLRWRGRGEGREWDAGKVQAQESEGGEVRVKAAWTTGLGL